SAARRIRPRAFRATAKTSSSSFSTRARRRRPVTVFICSILDPLSIALRLRALPGFGRLLRSLHRKRAAVIVVAPGWCVGAHRLGRYRSFYACKQGVAFSHCWHGNGECRSARKRPVSLLSATRSQETSHEHHRSRCAENDQGQG